YTFDPEKGGEIIFYYTVDEIDNITVKFHRIKGSGFEETPFKTDRPKGRVGTKLNLKNDSSYFKEVMPKGYHYATKDELTDKKDSAGNPLKQPDKEVEYVKDGRQEEEKIYIVGDANSSITVNFVDMKTGQVVLSDRPKGKTGDELDLTENSDYLGGKEQELQRKNYYYASENELKEGQKYPGKV
ncbi:hypothetical protein, partial [Lactobacillus sp.]|uniref:hypothetical protein n=1 Tax=Lactobacillus sp. TaxID=1591 RepID=UPI00258898A0